MSKSIDAIMHDIHELIFKKTNDEEFADKICDMIVEIRSVYYKHFLKQVDDDVKRIEQICINCNM